MAKGSAKATCLHCGHANTVTAPEGVCVAIWECSKCKRTFRLPPGFCV